jgi:hypothetical protein
MTTTDSAKQSGQPVVVTGIGIVSPVGHDARSTWDALVGGKSGIAPITRFDPSGYQTTFAGEVKGFDPAARMGRKDVRRTDRYSHFAVASALEALEHARLTIDDQIADRVGVLIGSGMGGGGNTCRRDGDCTHPGTGPPESFFYADVSWQHGLRHRRHCHRSTRSKLRAGICLCELGACDRRSGGDHQARAGRRRNRWRERGPSGSNGGSRIQRDGRIVDTER